MALEQLPPDELELRICSRVGVIPDCPFCGKHALLHSAINESPAFSKGPLYQGRIACTNHHCNTSMVHNARSRDEAQKQVIAQWSMRAGAAQPAGGAE